MNEKKGLTQPFHNRIISAAFNDLLLDANVSNAAEW
jgi:hypothetical protein